ncbi:nitronate monooxygenase [Bacillaceae bacterium SIJ1]|uniref:NAD(P)H-dependent flavin oxidoreductase n=1 Tax=Litoribacterium kuwaitense TaxID=1398745 RepID=UPI0013ED9962|nr:nitronate monooxygenase [Litoribacterium kuwaitense]NGP46449.1 nitronate monooxygenase [Litoribacterium kuwaitense]
MSTNRLLKKLRIKYPIIQAGMAGGPTTPALVSEVAESGGLGLIGAGYMTPEALRTHIHETKALTSQPFGVNLFVPECPEVDADEVAKANALLKAYRDALHIKDEPVVSVPTKELFDEMIDVVIREGIEIVSFTFGIPTKQTIARLKQAKITVIGTATTVREAEMNEEIGMDAVVAQGSEAGGHRGTFAGRFEDSLIGTMALVPQVVDRVNIPVIASGGIADGRGLIAALALGAEAVQMGTVFLTCEESGANELHQEAILRSKEVDTTLTKVFSGKPARGIRNSFIADMEKHENTLPAYPIQNVLTKEIRREAVRQSKPEWLHLWAGQNMRASQKQSVETLMKRIVEQAEETRLSIQ